MRKWTSINNELAYVKSYPSVKDVLRIIHFSILYICTFRIISLFSYSEALVSKSIIKGSSTSTSIPALHLLHHIRNFAAELIQLNFIPLLPTTQHSSWISKRLTKISGLWPCFFKGTVKTSSSSWFKSREFFIYSIIWIFDIYKDNSISAWPADTTKTRHLEGW